MQNFETIVLTIMITTVVVNGYYFNRFNCTFKPDVEGCNAVFGAISIIVLFLYGAFLVGKYWEFLRPYLSLFK